MTSPAGYALGGVGVWRVSVGAVGRGQDGRLGLRFSPWVDDSNN